MERRIQAVLAFLVASAVPSLGLAEVRSWSDVSGRYSVQAEFVELRDGMVRLEKGGGQVISIPLDRLSTADREYVRKQASQKPEAAEPEETPSEPGGTADVVEFLTGSKLQGKVTSRDGRYITIEVTSGSRTYTRKCPLDRVHAVTIGGRREVLHEASGGDGPPRPGPPEPAVTSGDARRSRAEIDALIDRLGRAPPDWWDSVALDYPKSLDLSWPPKPPEGWNNQRNVGQYIWDIINPNPGKWREGIRFMHHLLSVHEKNPGNRIRAMETLGRMYYNLEQDYARAAFWWRKAGIGKGRESPAGVKLAACYWKLGNKAMAVETLNRLPIYATAIKLWADMGETAKALQFAEALGRSGWPHLAYLYAGDACRIQGQYGKAVKYYEKVLAVPATGKGKEGIERCHQRARDNIEGIKIFDALDLRRIPDGTYQGTSPAYAGPLHVKVVVAGGRIQSVEVTGHQEKQFYSALTDTPRQIVQNQGVKGVDAVTGATITSEAIVNAAARALASGMK